MKNSIGLILLLFGFTTAYAQTNKPEPNALGVQYGVVFGSNISQNIVLSGWIKNGMEIRGGVTFSVVGSSNKTTDSANVQGISGSLAAQRVVIVKSSSYTVNPFVAVVKHFKTNNNLDFYLGGQLTAGVNTRGTTENSTEQTGSNYRYYTDLKQTYQPSVNLGLALVGGTNFFFYKNLAIGAEGLVGFTTSLMNGKTTTQNTLTNTGSNNRYNNNPSQNYNTLSTADQQNMSYGFNFAGNVGLKLTYYLNLKNHGKKVDKV